MSIIKKLVKVKLSEPTKCQKIVKREA
uniref:Uncharacterized protein n=1 Tax=Amphimedon queenslandica TaxID=400682 RepID=A0A1X7UQM4_AMPQE